jgi:biotin-dependent carboxylase-like uncharacterized protein
MVIEMTITFLQAGPMTTVQDAGRFGFMEYGIGQSGVMDYKSYLQANKLVGNPEDEAVLEMTLMGAQIMFDDDALVAYIGADMQALIDNDEMERGRAYQIKKGQTIKFGMAKSGVRAYLAIAGEIEVPIIMNSKSTNIKCMVGGFEGRKLKNNDNLQIKTRKDSDKKLEQLLKQMIMQEDYTGLHNIRVVLGPQDNLFSQEEINTFLTSEYSVSSESDRMGIRMNGSRIGGEGKTDIVSDGIVFGSIQITSSGQPIVMMADHQTTGGYAKIATVIKEDLPKLAQARPGDKVIFEKVEISNLQKRSIFKFLRKDRSEGK